jgi:hypothetical protein
MQYVWHKFPLDIFSYVMYTQMANVEIEIEILSLLW